MNAHISRILRHPATIPTVAGAVSFGVGVGIGILIGRKSNEPETHQVPEQLKLDFDKTELKMIIDANDYYREPPAVEDPVINTDIEEEEYISPLVDFNTKEDNTHKILERIAEDVIEDIPEPEMYNAFAASSEDWDYNLELAQRSDDAPYVIHIDEFYANERDYNQISLVYYAGDDILVDDEDKPIFNHINITGELKFGHGSNDPTLVFIRNPKNKAEYEISKDDDLYSSAVLGLEIEDNVRVKDIKHSSQRRFRDEM